jgi:integrase
VRFFASFKFSPLSSKLFKKIYPQAEDVNMEFLSPVEMAYTLGISEFALCSLAYNGTIPHTYILSSLNQDRLLRFNPHIIMNWMETRPNLKNAMEKTRLDRLKAQYEARFPDVIAELKTINDQFSPPRKAKGYSFTKVKSKKYGFLYYVRYIEKGKLVPSRWNTRTNNLDAAECFALENREKILTAYHAKYDVDDKMKSLHQMYTVLETYYKKNSRYIEIIKKRGRRLCEQVRSQNNSFINNVFIPFLKKNRVKRFNEISAPIMAKFQDELCASGLGSEAAGLKPQTINRYMIGIRTIFDHMVRDGLMAENILKRVESLKTKPGDCKVIGCYEADKPWGAFNRAWKDETSYMLNLLIYSTGMRNSEIMNIKPRDIINMGSCRFLDIKESKTDNGLRLVPLHPYVYEKLSSWIKKRHIADDAPVFPVKAHAFTKAYILLGKRLGFDKAALKERNIVFYSGRHYWKTLMNANDLGDIEEYFMGHKVSKDVAERYNHRDKQGQKRLLAKAGKMLRILDKTLFRGRPL